MTEHEIERFHDSFQRCMQRHEAFLDYFYDTFLQSAPEVADKFRHTDFKRQKAVLHASLLMILGATVRRTQDFSGLARTAQRHSRHEANIEPPLYALWLEALLAAASRFDERFSAETEAVWRAAFQPAIDYLIARY